MALGLARIEGRRHMGSVNRQQQVTTAQIQSTSTELAGAGIYTGTVDEQREEHERSTQQDRSRTMAGVATYTGRVDNQQRRA